jgi:hypothetical protein
VLAANRPTTSPRFSVNQRLATIAPSTSAVSPVPQPSTRPHSKNSCQSCVMPVASTIAAAMKPAAVIMMRRKPKRAMKTAANGPSRPNSAKRTANTDDNSSVDQPNSCDSGRNMAPGRPSAAEVVSIAKKVTPAMTHA